jgi:hypothetical protein
MPDLFHPVQPSEDWRPNTVIGIGWLEDDTSLALGFAELAKIGIKDILSNGPLDFLVVPIIFNYRHALELVLKDAIRMAAGIVRKDREAYGQPISRRLLASRLEADLSRREMHALGRLLDKLMYLLAEADMEPLPSETVKTIRQLHELDESGQTFRYSMVRADGDIAGEMRPARPDEIHIDVVQLAERLNAAFDLIHGELLPTLLEIQAEQIMEAIEVRGKSHH